MRAKAADKAGPDFGVGDPRIDTYIAKAPSFAQPILMRLRALVHQACPQVVETIKWSRPFFLYRGVILCNMSAFKEHCSFGFWNSGMTPLLKKGGILSGDAMGSLGRITKLQDLPTGHDLLAHIREAAQLTEASVAAGAKSKPAAKVVKPPKAVVAVPPDLALALKQSKTAAANFDAFSPSCRREYLEWIIEAKRAETRQRRIETAVAWIAEGKQRNWKYQ
jgi:uncharacterized protein YdeI (YjbR/CyaY-like superfamily)